MKSAAVNQRLITKQSGINTLLECSALKGTSIAYPARLREQRKKDKKRAR